jgi:hypothetical protein
MITWISCSASSKVNPITGSPGARHQVAQASLGGRGVRVTVEAATQRHEQRQADRDQRQRAAEECSRDVGARRHQQQREHDPGAGLADDAQAHDAVALVALEHAALD